MKIYILQTGGTISSEEVNGRLAASDKDNALVTAYLKLFNDVEFQTKRPINILSENITSSDLYAIYDEVQKATKEKPQGIIITHGSDTFDYTANYLSLTCKNSPVPIVLINALYPLSDSRTNGYSNFFGAVSFIKAAAKEGYGGVFAATLNPNDNVCRIMTAEHVLPCTPSGAFLPFDDFCGYVEGSEYIHNYDKFPIEKLKAKLKSPDKGHKLREDVLSLQVSAALNFDLIDIESRPPRAVVIGLYHSGTISTNQSGSFLRFAARCEKLNIPIILAGAKSSSNTYESSTNIPSNCSFAFDKSLSVATLTINLIK